MRPIDSVAPSTSFESVWGTHLKRKKYLFRCKKVVAIPLVALLALLSLSAAGFVLARQTDNTNYPFVDDPQAIGRWQAVDFVTNPADFNPDQKSWQGELYLTQMAFIKGGKMLLAVQNGNGNLAPAAATWTKGIVLNKQEQTASKYEIAGIDGSTYMFFEWKSGDYTFWHMKPKYYVLKKVDSLDYANTQIARTEDKIDYPFVNDPQMPGQWEGVDFVQQVDDFKPGVTSWEDGLFLTQLDLSGQGTVTGSTTKGPIPEGLYKWTKGLIISPVNKTASTCEIRQIDGGTYMFFEWKSGDYTFRGMQPWFYVLKKTS